MFEEHAETMESPPTALPIGGHRRRFEGISPRFGHNHTGQARKMAPNGNGVFCPLFTGANICSNEVMSLRQLTAKRYQTVTK